MTAARAGLTVGALDAVYLVTLGRLTPGDAAAGAAWAGLLLWWFHGHVFRRPSPRRHAFARIAAAVRLAAVVLGRAVASSLALVPAALGPGPRPAARIVEVPIGARTRAGIAATGLLHSVTPGTVLVDVDEARGLMLFLTIEHRSAEALRAEIEAFYDRYQRSVVA